MDRFILFLSRKHPEKSLPSRNMARMVLAKIQSENAKKEPTDG